MRSTCVPTTRNTPSKAYAHGEALIACLRLSSQTCSYCVGRLGLASLFAKLVDLVGDGGLQAVHTLAAG